jgi:hypothetical protein
MIKLGDKITTKREVAAFYSCYGGNPKIVFSPDMIGTVGAVKIPVVRNTTGHTYYHCIDFLSPVTGKMERCALYTEDIIPIK